MRKTSPRLSETNAQFYLDHHPTLNAGLEYWIEAIPSLWTRTLYELRGHFTIEELILLIDEFKDSTVQAAMAGQTLNIRVINSLSIKSVDKETLIAKIARLTIFEKAVLEIWAMAFNKTDKNLDEWILPLLLKVKGNPN